MLTLGNGWQVTSVTWSFLDSCAITIPWFGALDMLFITSQTKYFVLVILSHIGHGVMVYFYSSKVNGLVKLETEYSLQFCQYYQSTRRS